MEQDFAGKVALVTGGGSGIGRAAAILFARRGAKVCVVDRDDDTLNAVVKEIAAGGADVIGIAADISDPSQAEVMVSRAVARFGRLDAAFNNAGISGPWGPIGELNAADFDTTIGVNLRGTWLCCRAQIVQMQHQGGGGAIVCTSSWLAHGALPGSSLYAASKAALNGMTRALAIETAADHIRINNVNPGIIDTPMLRRDLDDITQIPFTEHTPLRRLGTAEEIAEVAVFLCSDAASFMIGQDINIDGGYTTIGHRPWLKTAQ